VPSKSRVVRAAQSPDARASPNSPAAGGHARETPCNSQREQEHRRKALQRLGLRFTLVLPAEESFLPHVGPALAACRFGRAALEGKRVALRVGRDRVGMVDQMTEVVEVGLRRGTLRQIDVAPFRAMGVNRLRLVRRELVT
jgi:hypothetical protein